MNTKQEPACHMWPSDLKKFETAERSAKAYSIAMMRTDERTVPLYAAPQPPEQGGLERLAGEIANIFAEEFLQEKLLFHNSTKDWFPMLDSKSTKYRALRKYLIATGRLEEMPDHPELVRVGEKS